MAWTKKQREVATKNGEWLIAIAVDGRPAKQFGGLEFAGPVDEATGRRVLALINDRVKCRAKRLARTQPIGGE